MQLLESVEATDIDGGYILATHDDQQRTRDPAADARPPFDRGAWQRIEPYLDRALDMDTLARGHWLDELERSEPMVATMLRSLLAEHQAVDAERFLDAPLTETAQWVAQFSMIGRRIGAYTIDSFIARGGMGEVWLASRSDGRFEGRCAIKFLDSSRTHRQLADRFEREGRLLARVAHPNIARLIDAGTTEEGRQYLLIEHVDGERIDSYCESRSLDVRARVRLFLDVVAAVAHAHSHLIIHRDLKPSNVFVTSDGVVKLLDFGIAKLVSADPEPDASGLTRLEEAVLTPEYAAPEQVVGDFPSTATDIYQLGLLLYVLLVGRHPVAFSRTHAERIRTALDGSIPLASSLSERQTRKQLQGDLDAILAKALRRNPSERYITAQAMHDDLLRHLNGEAVHARRGATFYRARKFIGRNRTAVAAAMLMVVGLFVSLVLVNQQRLIAERRFDQLRHLSSKVFELDGTISSLQGATAARRQLVATSLDYLEGLAANAQGDEDLQFALADAYWRVARIQGVPAALNLGDTAHAEQSLVKSAAHLDALRKLRRNDVDIQFLAAQVASDRMIVADTEGRRADALVHAREATDGVERFFKLGSGSETKRRDALLILSNVALAYLNLSQYEDSVRTSESVLALAKSLPPQTVERIAGGATSVLSNALRLQGDLPAALAAIEQAKRISEQTIYDNEQLRASDTYSLLLREGLILGEDGGISLNRPADAIVAFQEAVDLTAAIADRDPDDNWSRARLATASRELGSIVRHTDPQRALAIFDTALTRLAELPMAPKLQRQRAELLACSADALNKLGRRADARQRLDTAIALLNETKDLPAERIVISEPTWQVLNALAELEASAGSMDKAVETYRFLLDRLDRTDPDPRTDLRAAVKLTRLYAALAEVYRRTGDTTQWTAIEAQRKSLWSDWRRRFPEHPIVASHRMESGLR